VHYYNSALQTRRPA